MRKILNKLKLQNIFNLNSMIINHYKLSTTKKKLKLNPTQQIK